MITEPEIRARLTAVLEDAAPIGEFYNWLETASWNMHADSEPAAIDLAATLSLARSEYEHDDWDEIELRQQMKDALTTHP